MTTVTTQIAWNQLTAITEGKGSTRKIGHCLGMKVPGTKFSCCFRAYFAWKHAMIYLTFTKTVDGAFCALCSGKLLGMD